MMTLIKNGLAPSKWEVLKQGHKSFMKSEKKPLSNKSKISHKVINKCCLNLVSCHISILTHLLYTFKGQNELP